jgi:hypothetical protein
MENEATQKRIDLEELKNSRILQIINFATLVSISMLLFYFKVFLNKSRSRHVNGDVAPNLFRNIYNVYKSIS